MDGEEQLLFRTMRAARDGFPEVGRTRRTLGVKVCPAGVVPADPADSDVYPDANDRVEPGRGMSVAVGDPRGLPKHRRPPALGGESRDPLFALRIRAIPASLRLHEDHALHPLVEPQSPCLLADYEAALAGGARIGGSAMSDALKRYRDLEGRLIRIRWLHQGRESPEEDEILDAMDAAWWKLAESERSLLDAEGVRSLVRHGALPIRAANDEDVWSNPGEPPRRREVA